jgi:hypothetical protein
MMLIFTPDVDNTSTIGTATYTGTGPNDCVFDGPYTGTTAGSTFYVEIDGEGTTDTFRWRKDAEAWTSEVAITAEVQQLKEGISVNFAITSGHTEGDLWTLEVDSPSTLNLNDLGAKLIYKNVGGALENLDTSDIKAGMPAAVVYSDDQDCWLLLNPSDPVYSSLVPSRIRKQVAVDYTLLVSDHGNEINFINATAKILTLESAATYADMFFYIRAGGAGNVTITADGTELIYGKRAPAGSTTYVLIGGQSDIVQITTNGVDWHVTTESPNVFSRQVFETLDSPHTYTKPWDVRYILAEVYGAGAGGSRADTGVIYPAGGGGGGYSQKFIDAAAITTETVTVGAGGAGGAAVGADGVNGGASSFGTHCSATGGTKGQTTSIGIGGAGGAGADGDINLNGQQGAGYTVDTYEQSFGGAGAGPLGGVATPYSKDNGIDAYDGGAGNSVGGGGGGGFDNAGGTGADGLVIITEYR